MKGLNKLILASAIAAVSASSFAMEALDEDTMSNTTGQDGLTISLGTDITIGAVRIHDKDGLNGIAGLPNVYGATNAFTDYFAPALGGTSTAASVATPAESATIKITGGAAGQNGVNADQGIAIRNIGGAQTVLTIDAGAKTGGTEPVLHIGVTAAAQEIGLGGTVISVQSGDGSAAATATNSANILSFDAGTRLTTGGATLNIDLGNQPNGALVWGQCTLNEDAAGNLITLSSLNVLQGNNGIGLSNIAVQAAGPATFVTTDLRVSVVAGGLEITTATVGGTGMDISIGDIRLGANYTVASGGASIGSVYIDNLRQGANTITIAGH